MTTGQSRGIGVAFVLAGALLWGTTGTTQALGTEGIAGGVPPPVVGAARIAVGGAGLVVLAVLTGALPSLTVMRERHVAVPLATGAVAIAVYQLAFFASVARTGVALGTVVAIGSAPAFTGLVGWLVRGERPEREWLPATLLAVAGCVLLLAPRGGGGGVEPLGVGLALVAGMCFGVGTVSMKRVLDAGVASTGVVALIFGGGALLLLPVLVGADLAWTATVAGAGMVVYLGLGATTLAYMLFSRGLQHVRSSSAATLSLAEPLTAALLGLALLGERLGLAGWSGALLVLGGLVVLALGARRRS